MTDYGMLDTGFQIKPRRTVEKDTEAAIKSLFGENANVTPPGVLGQIKFLFADGKYTVWEILAALYESKTIRAAGNALDDLAELTGISRRAARKAYIEDFELTFTAGATVSAGATFSVDGDGDTKFALDSDVTAAGAGTETATVTATAAGKLSNITDDVVTEIDSPVAGLSSVTNPASSTFANGADEETDAELRSRMQNRSASSIYRAIDNLNADETGRYESITGIKIIENNTSSVDSDGRAAHSFEVVIWYDDAISSPDTATDQAIAEAIAENKAGGIQAVSTTSTTVTKTVALENGQERSISFSKPARVAIAVDIEVAKDNAENLSIDERADIESDIMDYFDNLEPGDDVIVYGRNSISDALNEYAGANLTDYTIAIGLNGSGISSDDNYSVDDDEIVYTTTGITNVVNF